MDQVKESGNMRLLSYNHTCRVKFTFYKKKFLITNTVHKTMSISDNSEPYLTVIKIVLISFIFGSAANLSKYIYNFNGGKINAKIF